METKAQVPSPFTYERPELKRAKTVKILARTDRTIGVVQVVREGGETNLHTHPTADGFWFVLSGRARFYTSDDAVLGELGRHEGILIPHGFPYWFESASDEPLEVLQVAASDDPSRMMERVNLEDMKQGSREAEVIEG